MQKLQKANFKKELKFGGYYMRKKLLGITVLTAALTLATGIHILRSRMGTGL